ncbi:MAG: hypothetical protein ACFFEF_11910 [Candidatus Thorarchaeota archaeon]
MTDCKICGRKGGDEELCDYHQAAYTNLKSAYKVWSEAEGHLTWEEYVKQVYELEGTGRWVKEIIENIMLQNDS